MFLYPSAIIPLNHSTEQTASKYVHEVCLGAYVNSLYMVPMLIVFISNVLIPVVTTAFLWFKVLV